MEVKTQWGGRYPGNIARLGEGKGAEEQIRVEPYAREEKQFTDAMKS